MPFYVFTVLIELLLNMYYTAIIKVVISRILQYCVHI